jgi:multidrug efflux pump subunit AcrA (membrane-fusion protein)
MSIEQPLDQRLVDQTKRQIQALVQEIEQLSRQDLSPGEFYREFLGRVVSALAAVGGAVWAVNEDHQLALQYQVNFQLAYFGNDAEAQGRHARLLYQCLSATEGMLVPPHSGTGGEEGGANLTDYLLVLAPLRTDLEVAGVVEVLQRADTEPTVQRGYLRFLLEMCQRAGDFLKSRQLRHFSDRQVLWSRLEDFTRTVHASLEPIETAYTIANEGRRLIECDRVSVAVRKGNKCVIEAVSGQDVFDKRSNTIRLLGRLATAVVRSGEAMWYTGDTADMAPQVEEAVQEYVDESHSKTVAVLPLRRPPLDEEDDAQQRREPPPPVGALIVEQIEDSRPAPAMAQRVEVVCRHSSLAMANALEHQSLFLMPVWRALGKARWIVGARTLPKTLTIAAAVLALLAALCFWPKDFNVQCKGTLEPVDHREVFAGIDGVVDEVPVHAGQEVAKQQLLVRLRNTDAEQALIQVEGQLVEVEEETRSRQRMLDDRQLRSEDRIRLFGELAEAREKRLNLEAQRVLCRQRIEQLSVRSPIQGVVVTWELNNRLGGRPVLRGQSLLRVADPKGPWQLELHVPDNDIGFLTSAQHELGKEREVTYILATDPAASFHGKVSEIAESAEVRGDEGNTVLVKVAIDKSDLADPRPGATVSAKVYCGRRPVGYVLFHSLIAFVQSHILFRL